MADLDAVLADLAAEGADLDELVNGADAGTWAKETPAAGWTIAHQIAHLAWTDEVSIISVTDPESFKAVVKNAWEKPTTFVDDAAEELAEIPTPELLERWRASRKDLITALSGVVPGRKLDWFGPPMSAASMATARIMETWAHGQDVADTVGVRRSPTARLKHVAHIGIRARNFAYSLHNETPPTDEFRVELLAPDGTTWTWGPEDAAQRVTGPALDFCLLVTQRRHLDDLAVEAVGPDATHWLSIAQSFAGAPGTGRAPGQFAQETAQA
ncbi:TIGR03084 family protein [Antrihabitans sp. YC3-6]|uniref:TIGR03084 family protein n=1 Tax=Antrihabitans stalagmiti TaxID=2799499 RepID=A0A934U131_9NOCA|nr:TIGR03084 family metal-binding protein [Antrihabitans stalagmiti]MBJ8337891.1 TIGR03084 family protein [Antrihabitans stalagmiti]